MPVALVSFTATAQLNHSVDVEWTTSLETNNKGFVVKRNKDLKLFEPVGEVGELVPNSSAMKTYQGYYQSGGKGQRAERFTASHY